MILKKIEEENWVLIHLKGARIPLTQETVHLEINARKLIIELKSFITQISIKQNIVSLISLKILKNVNMVSIAVLLILQMSYL